jgi:HAD superfamily hydrolase (TIGR01662 family)
MTLSTKAYKLIIFDLDGTLTPARTSSAAPFEQRLLPGVKEKCQELKQQGVKLAVATNQQKVKERQLQRHMDWIDSQLGGLTDWVYACREDAQHMKPSPSMLQSTMVLRNIKNTDTLMVGDSIDDQKAALAAGVDFEWAATFFGWDQEEE